MIHDRALASIYLHGPLGERFGETHRLAVSSPIEAVAALDANYPGFLREFAKVEAYGLYADGDWRGGDMAGQMPFSRELHFCPVIEGQAFLGAMLVTAIFPGIAGTTASIIGGVLMAGVMFGLSYLLAPKAPSSDTTKDDNYAFSGPENVTGQGVAVPLIYGRVYAGSVVISAGLDLGTDIAATVPVAAAPDAPPSTAISPPGTAAPPGGWPPIVFDNLGRPGPQGWHYVGMAAAISDMTVVATGNDQVGKTVDTWQHPTATRYFYNRVRGFYYSPLAKVQPAEADWNQPRGGGGHT